MWRTELWHPLVVHFPIALLLIGTLFRLGGAVVSRTHRRLAFLRPAGQALLALGTAGAWVAVYTGSLADSIVVRSLCDPTVLESHENLAYRVAISLASTSPPTWRSLRRSGGSRPARPEGRRLCGAACWS